MRHPVQVSERGSGNQFDSGAGTTNHKYYDNGRRNQDKKDYVEKR